MHTHEFQAKSLLQKYGIPIPPYFVVSSLDQVQSLIEQQGLNAAVLKIQVHAGGRGKAGGVKLAGSPEEILQYAKQLLGKKIVNQQTGPEGMIAHQILITPPVTIQKEYYLGAVIDRQKAQGVLIASPEGGMDIEEVAHKYPEKILTFPLPLSGKLRSYHLLRIAKFMGWQGEMAAQGMQILSSLSKAFVETDASLLEINPLVETKEGKLVALDAKLTVDDNALFRQPEIKAFFDPTQLLPNEADAHKHELAYVALEGSIGCMVNGAGLAMATMDIIHHFGGEPANFLDVGGGASKEKVAEGFKIILSDSKVKAILVNIFGGIMNCETLASGIIAAANELHIHVPLIIRMEGTNVNQGKQLLKDSGLNLMIANNLTEAAQKAVEVAK
jgi:succinyl-CoA synthetase beta subunit